MFPEAPDGGAGRIRTGADELLADVGAARRDLVANRHPAYHRILGALAALLGDADAGSGLIASFERTWKSRTFPTFYERPLLVLAALRFDALDEGPSHPLHGALASPVPDPEVVTEDAVLLSLSRERLGVWSTMTTRRVQTNDTSRAVTWLFPAELAGCSGGKRPLALADVGAGAGLNLVADGLPRPWTEVGSGRSVPCATDVETAFRLGFDTRPLDVNDEDAVRWMRACIWSGEQDRLSRFDASVNAFRGAVRRRAAPSLERLTASLVAGRLTSAAEKLPEKAFLIAYQTLVRGYLEPKEREAYVRSMGALVATRPHGSTAWLELELDDSRRKHPAALVAHVRVRNTVKALRLARSSQHPTELDVDSSAVAEFRRAVAMD